MPWINENLVKTDIFQFSCYTWDLSQWQTMFFLSASVPQKYNFSVFSGFCKEIIDFWDFFWFQNYKNLLNLCNFRWKIKHFLIRFYMSWWHITSDQQGSFPVFMGKNIEFYIFSGFSHDITKSTDIFGIKSKEHDGVMKIWLKLVYFSSVAIHGIYLVTNNVFLEC